MEQGVRIRAMSHNPNLDNLHLVQTPGNNKKYSSDKFLLTPTRENKTNSFKQMEVKWYWVDRRPTKTSKGWPHLVLVGTAPTLQIVAHINMTHMGLHSFRGKCVYLDLNGNQKKHLFGTFWPIPICEVLDATWPRAWGRPRAEPLLALGNLSPPDSSPFITLSSDPPLKETNS